MLLEILGRPHRQARALRERHWRIQHLAFRRVAIVQRRRIDERLEGRARLALRLHGAIELAGGKTETAGEREDAAGVRVHYHDGAIDLRHLAQSVMAELIDWLDIDD